MNRIKYFLVLIILILLLDISRKIFFKDKNVEHFEDIENKLLYKKTLNFRKVWYNGNDDYTVWEPEPDGDYYPVGNIIIKGKNRPKYPEILIKSNTDNNSDRPLRYELVSFITIENMDSEGFKKVGIWKPVCNKYYRSLGHIIQVGYKPPSIHRIRCVSKKFLNVGSLENIIAEGSSHIKSLKGYNLWKILDSNYFIGNDKNNSEEPLERVYNINTKYLDVEDKLPIKKTNLYTLIWRGYNKETKKSISIWRPKSTEKYVSIGDIAYDGKDPNGILETILVHKKYAKPVEDFGSKPVVKYFQDKEVISFWKPKPPKDYGCIGFIANKGSSEPESNTICYSLPLKYLKLNKNEDKEKIWSTIQLSIQKLSIWRDENNYFIVNNNYSYPEDIYYKLENALLKINRDLLDVEQRIVLKYKLNKYNREMYNSDTKEKLFITSLSSRLGITSSRIHNIRFEEGKIVKIKIVSRPSGSDEPLVYQIINNIESQIKNNTLKINNSKNDGFIADIIYMDIDTENINKDNIPLDNTQFLNNLRD